MPVTGSLTRKMSPARSAAFDTLEAVAGGAYASDALRRGSRHLAGHDAGLAAQIVFGCLRYQSQLDYLIFYYSSRSAEELDLAVRLALRAGIFQLRYLERIPAHAAVDESVEFVKTRKRAATGFTNAVLRKVNRKPVQWPDEATELSCPVWLLERWRVHFGPEAARGIATAALQEPIPYIRIPPGLSGPPELQAEPTSVPGAHRLLTEHPPGQRLHDISSQAIIPLLNLRPGDTYLDLCAAPGNKTSQALETPLALAVACDISVKRIRDISPVCLRVVLDASEPLPFAIEFQRIFIDAPCSGTGTLARNPEIKWRLKGTDLERFHEMQLAIVSQAVSVLAPAGKLLYATCSLEREENEDVIRDFLDQHPSFRCTREVWRLPGRDEGDGFYAAVLE
ncbi:MAG: hypothetical protein M3Y72_27410, partial [Acidobacteriota bacterium]|nr:hypothetical protein [Acidobacteriota bacterium]